MSEKLWVDIEYREDIGDWLNANGLIGEAAEVGCMYGGYAQQVLHKWKGYRYWMIDPWERQPASIYKERTDDTDYESCYRQCQELAERDKRVRLIRKLSVDAARDIENNTLDMVFIDGNHCYQAVLEDIDAWWPKLKKGGVMGFDDYGNDTNWPNFIEVKRAVDRFCAEHRLPFAVDRRPAAWVIKP